jgi:hypothetical protein
VRADNVHAAGIDCINRHGITTGISATRYGPGRITTRGQMASFLARTIRAAGRDLPNGPNAFGDDDNSVHHSAINALAAAGVVSGVTEDSYAPRRRVSREQMASMLLGAYAYITGSAPATAATDYFDDDNNSVHEASVNVAAELGLIVGRGERIYDPLSGVRRDQMASFLMRLLNAGATP